MEKANFSHNNASRYPIFLLAVFLIAVQFQLNAFTITENLRDKKSNSFLFGGNAYLTAGINDSVGDGWLRLTNDTTWQTGYALLKPSFPSKLGILIDLEMMIWHSSSTNGGADGISIFLYDASTPVFNIGAFGGSLGYAQYLSGSGTVNKPGVSNGFLGLGIDEFGNYSNPTEGRVGGVGFKANSIGLRGPASTNYAWVTGNTNLPFSLQIGQFASRPNTELTYRRIQIEISPTTTGGSTTQYSVTARIKTSKNGEFQSLFAPYVLPYYTPDSLKLGFGASTGSKHNFHDVRNLMISTPNGVRAVKTVDRDVASVGDQLTYTVHLYNQTPQKVIGLKLTDSFNYPSSFKIDSVFFNNQGNSSNTALGYSIYDLSNVTVNMDAYGDCIFRIKGTVLSYPSGGIISNTANFSMGSSGLYDPDMSNNISAASTQIIAPDKKITLIKSVANSSQFHLGDVIKYNFTVGNPGGVVLSNIKITDSKLTTSPVYVSGDTNSDNILDPGENWLYSGNYTVTQADIDSGKVVNRALVTSKDPLNAAVTDTSGITASDNLPTIINLSQNNKIILLKSVSSTGTYKAGSTIRYAFMVGNAGNTVLSHVNLTDNKLLSPPVYQSGDLNGDGKLDVGETWLYAADYVVTQADVSALNVVNSATVTAKDPQGNLVSDISGSDVTNDSPTVTPIDQNGKISLTKTITNSGPFKLGDNILYLFAATNMGNTKLTALNIIDNKLLNPVVYSGGDVNNNGTCDPGETWNYTSSYNVTQADVDVGYVSNTATITTSDNNAKDISGPTSYEDAPTVTVLPRTPRIAIIKTVSNTGIFRLGDMIKYDFTVANTGNVTLKIDSLTDVRLPGRKGIYVSGDNNGNGFLDVGEIWVYSGSYKVVQADVDSARVTNSAIIYARGSLNELVTDISGSTTINDYPTVTPVSQSPKVALVKTVISNGPYTLGSTISYLFTVTNTGNVTLSDISVKDNKMTSSITQVSGDANGQLAVGESWTFVGNHVVNQSEIDAGYVVNSATVSAKTPQDVEVSDVSGSAINNNYPTVSVTTQFGRITLVKQVANPGIYKIGSEIDYLFTVTNTGNITLTEPIITDNRLANDPVYVSGDLNSNDKIDVGESWIFRGSYVVTHADVLAGLVVNSAVASAYDPLGSIIKDVSGISATDDQPTVSYTDQTPVAVNDSVTTKSGIDVTIPVLNNDLSGGTLIDVATVQIVTQPQHGTLTLNADGTVVYSPNEDYVGYDQFTYLVKDADGKSSNVATVSITVQNNQLFIPNVFTPNGDGKNDLFEIAGIDSYSKVDLTIVNRWGSEVYHSASYHNDWDGGALNEGTYYYVLKLEKKDKKTTYTGWVLLKR